MEKTTLYDTNKNSKTKVWSIRVTSEAVIETTYGQLHGKQITNLKQIAVGKNVGKKNETTPLQQAVAEAKATIALKTRSGYQSNLPNHPKETNSNENENNDNETIVVGVRNNKLKEVENEVEEENVEEENPSKLLLPMLLNDYNKCSKHIVFPCYTQPKLDGVRAIYQCGKFHSRGGKPFGGLEHITTALQSDSNDGDIVLDGELFSYTLPFEQLVGTIKKVKKSPEDINKIQQHVIYLVFDVVDPTKTFKERFAVLSTLGEKYGWGNKDSGSKVVLVTTKLCENKNNVEEQYEEAMRDGMEGLVLRNSDGLYRPKYRSLHVQKLKNFESDEFVVVDFKEGSGSDSGTIIFICKISSGKTFSARPRGSIAERKALFVNGKEFIGKLMTIRYQELTSAGIPRFPVALAVIREDT